MKNNFTFIVGFLLLFSAVVVEAQNTVYPGVTETGRLYKAPRAATPPTIDGNPSDVIWDIAPWKQAIYISPLDATSWATGTPSGKEGEFSGTADVSFKYKFLWDDNRYYMLMRWTDDEVVYADNHNGYRVGSVPSYVTATGTVPAAGAGDGTAFQAFRMDMVAYWLTPHTDALANGTITNYNRNNNGLYYNFFPGKITKSTQAEAVLWAPKHNPVSTVAGAPQTHQAFAVGTFNQTEGAYYIEFRDTTWAALFSTVRTKLAGQKDFSTTAPVVGDKFLFQGEVNDADGITNRRDYVNYTTHMDLSSVVNPLQNLSQALVIELVDQISGVRTNEAGRSLEFYPNPNSTGTLLLNRVADVEIFNLTGQRILQAVNVSEVNISVLQPGIYMVKDELGNVGKLIRK
jgi:hypothetical protein